MKTRKIESSYGYWKVNTEGDCEGRSVKNLGTFRGHIDEIAFHLADKCYYSLRFSPIEKDEITPEFLSNSDSVHVSLDIDTGTWDMKPDRRVDYFREILKDRTEVGVEDSMYYASVKLISRREKSMKEVLRENALAKLTDEDKKILGLV